MANRTHIYYDRKETKKDITLMHSNVWPEQEVGNGDKEGNNGNRFFEFICLFNNTTRLLSYEYEYHMAIMKSECKE
jgi:hypothetical protein